VRSGCTSSIFCAPAALVFSDRPVARSRLGRLLLTHPTKAAKNANALYKHLKLIVSPEDPRLRCCGRTALLLLFEHMIE